jgi:SAM-dependent methyltransferase
MYEDEAYHRSDYFAADVETGGPEVALYERALDWVDAHGSARPKRLLDVGSGSGLFLELARKRGWSVEGIEISERLSARARERFGVPVRSGDFTTLALEPKAYDVVTMWDLLEHVLDPIATLAKVRESLAPGGLLVVLTIDSASLFNRIGDLAYRASFGLFSRPLELLYDARHTFYFSRRTLEAVVGRAGFRVEGRATCRAHLGRWVSEPVSWPIRAGGAVVDWLSVPLRSEYRQLVYCTA